MNYVENSARMNVLTPLCLQSDKMNMSLDLESGREHENKKEKK